MIQVIREFSIELKKLKTTFDFILELKVNLMIQIKSLGVVVAALR